MTEHNPAPAVVVDTAQLRSTARTVDQCGTLIQAIAPIAVHAGTFPGVVVTIIRTPQIGALMCSAVGAALGLWADAAIAEVDGVTEADAIAATAVGDAAGPTLGRP